MNRMFSLIPAAMIIVMMLALGCSNDSNVTSTGGGDNPEVTLSKYSDLVEAIAPPVFSGGGAFSRLFKPTDDSISWWYGDYCLLGKVFSEDEPMSLYRNTEELDNAVEFINTAIENGITDTSFTHEDDSGSVAIEIAELTEAVVIPENCRGILKMDSLELDYFVEFALDSMDLLYQAGFKKNDTDEYFLTYFSAPYQSAEYPDGEESAIFYAHRDLSTDAIDIRGVFYKDYGDVDETKAIWGYHIKTVNDDDFDYSMSWYSNELPDDQDLLGCIIGGGDKDTEFILRYRQCVPADTNVFDENYIMDRKFGSNYTDLGTDLSSFWTDLYPTDSMYTYDDLPTELLTSPLDPGSELSPWGGK